MMDSKVARATMQGSGEGPMDQLGKLIFKPLILLWNLERRMESVQSVCCPDLNLRASESHLEKFECA